MLAGDSQEVAPFTPAAYETSGPRHRPKAHGSCRRPSAIRAHTDLFCLDINSAAEFAVFARVCSQTAASARLLPKLGPSLNRPAELVHFAEIGITSAFSAFPLLVFA